MVVNSDKTPEAIFSEASQKKSSSVLNKALQFLKKAWGVETFSDEETTCENEMSVVQFATICNETILLTGDAGRNALNISIAYLRKMGINIPSIRKFHVPHHGSRRNVSSKILDTLIGTKLSLPLVDGQEKGIAMISASKDDDDHPRKTTVRALIHRGFKVSVTKGSNFFVGYDVPKREGYSPIVGLSYPDEEEE